MELTTLADTQQIAQDLVDQWVGFVPERPLVIGIDGPLGAGKTTLVKALAQALEIAEPIVSPTYTYLEEYPFVYPGFKGTLYHLDAWRIEDQAVFEQLKLNELITPGTIVVIEWFNQIKPWLEAQLLTQNARLITVMLEEKQGKRRASFALCEYTNPLETPDV